MSQIENILETYSTLSDTNLMNNLRSGQRGQAVVEYVLILVVSVAMATLATRLMVSRNPESPGVIIGHWGRVGQAIESDLADRVSN